MEPGKGTSQEASSTGGHGHGRCLRHMSKHMHAYACYLEAIILTQHSMNHAVQSAPCAALPRQKRTKTNDMKVRMMLPMSVRCKTCGNFMYKASWRYSMGVLYVASHAAGNKSNVNGVITQPLRGVAPLARLALLQPPETSHKHVCCFFPGSPACFSGAHCSACERSNSALE